MTEREAKNKIVSWAAAQVGFREGENNWNRYAVGKTDVYGWDVQNQPWCDVFVDAGFIECFGVENAKKLTYQSVFSALCSASAQYYKNNQAWYSSPEVGDQIFFYYEGGINHTGIVTAVADGRVTTVEGNSSDMVARRVWAQSALNIAGYGRPNWRVLSSAPTQESSGGEAADDGAYEYDVKIRLLRQGSRGPQVKNVQTLLLAQGFDCGAADGIFGPLTAGALRSFQRAHALAADGEFGGESFRALWNS